MLVYKYSLSLIDGVIEKSVREFKETPKCYVACKGGLPKGTLFGKVRLSKRELDFLVVYKWSLVMYTLDGSMESFIRQCKDELDIWEEKINKERERLDMVRFKLINADYCKTCVRYDKAIGADDTCTYCEIRSNVDGISNILNKKGK